jgi:hypothetical protein
MKTHREKVLEQLGLSPSQSYSLEELSKKSHVPLEILQEVYNRGYKAHSTAPDSVRLKSSYVKNVKAPMSAKLSAEQWAWGRIFSFLSGSKKHDNDLRANKDKIGGWNKGTAFVRRAMAMTKHKNKGYKPPAQGDYDIDIAYDVDKPSVFIQNRLDGVPKKFAKRHKYPKRVKSEEELERERVHSFDYWGLTRDDFEVIDDRLVEKKYGLLWPPILFEGQSRLSGVINCWGLRCCRFKRGKNDAKEMIPTKRHYEWIYFRDEDKCGELDQSMSSKKHGVVYRKPIGIDETRKDYLGRPRLKYELVKPPGANPPKEIGDLVRQPARARKGVNRSKNKEKKEKEKEKSESA